MAEPLMPPSLDEWDMDKLNGFIKLRDIERETFDFKGTDFKKLYEHLCAFANYSGGYIVLGIKSTVKNGRVIGYEKIGFDDDKEDWVQNEINNSMFLVDPIPNVRIKYLHENKQLYPVLQIKGDDFAKPYFVKNSGQCFIRIGASSSPASRTTIMNLFNNLVTKRNTVERLRVSANLLKESLMYTSERIRDVGPTDVIAKIPLVNLDYLRNTVLDTEWFLTQNDLYGGHIRTDYLIGGFHSFLYDIELLNISVDSYNKESYETNKESIKHNIRYWEPNRGTLKNALGFLNTVILKSDEFLSRFG